MSRRSTRISALNDSRDSLTSRAIITKSTKRPPKRVVRRINDSDDEIENRANRKEDSRITLQLQQFDIEVKTAIKELETSAEMSLKDLEAELNIQIQKVPKRMLKMKVKDFKASFSKSTTTKTSKNNKIENEIINKAQSEQEDYLKETLMKLQQMASQLGLSLDDLQNMKIN